MLDVLWLLPDALRANRTLIAAALVVALSGLSFTVAAGGLGVPQAARAAPGQQQGPTGSEPPGGASPRPGDSERPDASEPPASGTPGASGPIESQPPGSGPRGSEPSFQPLPTSS